VGRAEGVGRLLGVPYVPVTPFFPLLGVLGALPLPTKWFIRFGKPIRLEAQEVEARWQRARQEATRVRRTIQEMVVRLKRRRRSGKHPRVGIRAGAEALRWRPRRLAGAWRRLPPGPRYEVGSASWAVEAAITSRAARRARPRAASVSRPARKPSVPSPPRPAA